MARLIAEMRAQHDAEVLCGVLLHRGSVDPCHIQVMEGGGDVLICFSVLHTWTKGFLVPRDKLTPDHVEGEFEAWKGRVREQIRNGAPSKPVREAIQRWGSEAVTNALKPRSLAA